MRNKILILLFFISGFCKIGAQSFDFKSFDSDMGLPQNFVYCLAQDDRGYLWIGTGEGLVRYDGLRFITYTRNDSLASDFVHSLFVDHTGVLWVGHGNGTLSYYDDGFHKVIPKELATSPIKDICQDESGNIWATVQNNGVIRITPDKQIKTFFDRELFGNKLYYSIASIDEFHFLLGTSDGLFTLKVGPDDEVRTLEEVDVVPPTVINKIVKRRAIEGEYWIATEDEGFYLYKYDNKKAEHFANNQLCIKFDVEQENILDIFEEKDGNLMLATWGKGIIKLFWDNATQTFTESFNFSTANGLNHDFIKSILADRENNYWFASYGGGVSVLLDESFIHYDLEDIGFKQQKAISVLATNDKLWIGLDNGVLKTDQFCFSDHEYYDSALGIPNDRITGFEYDKDGVLWVSSLNKGLYYRKNGDLKFKRYNYTSSIIGNYINDMALLNSKIYLATSGGFFIIDTEDDHVEKYTTENKLPHNNINFVYVDKNEKVWIGPKSSGICMLDSANIEVHKLSQAPINVSGMTKDKDGNIWLSTVGKGVLKYTKDTLQSISVLDGLSKNYCYDIVCDKNNRLWVCHWPGISSIDLNTMQIRNMGFKDKMGGDFYRVWEDKSNNIWFASSHGVIKYFPDRDEKNLVAPLLNFTEIDISGNKYPINKPIELSYPYGKPNYRFRFEFTGISFKDPLAVTYQYKMIEDGEEEDKEWDDLGSTNFREYEFLPSGKYTLKVRAYNADGVVTKNPIAVSINIELPFWKKFWFYITIAVLGVLVVFWIIKYRERALRLQKEALQQEVASQTVVLRKQKAEIEKKNQDITASITYAKRIQKSILPQVDTLRSTFPESFIFFAPRDIVSGDFYWFNRTKDVFTLCCADCTGHGVPGAFMSMIGSTLLNDIYKLNGINSPADILERLDADIRILLQREGDDQAKDGMDISVIQINMSTGKVVLASAKRPVYLYINNELTVYNGTRRSIGDDEMTSDTSFVDYEYDCSKGDSIYLFSDGYPDQFGGPRGKKMMKVGVKRLLEEIHQKPMEKQGELVRDNFMNWMGDLEQVDDVLFMGLRL